MIHDYGEDYAIERNLPLEGGCSNIRNPFHSRQAGRQSGDELSAAKRYSDCLPET
jgi:hypothetical protein